MEFAIHKNSDHRASLLCVCIECLYTCIISFFSNYRLWNTLGNRWNLESELPPLHVSCWGIIIWSAIVCTLCTISTLQLTCNTHQTTAGGLTLSLPNVCTASPLRGKAFCKDHCSLLEKEASHVPTGLKEFLHYCHALRTGVRHNCTELQLVFYLKLITLQMMVLFVSRMLFLIKWKLLSVSCLHPLYLWSNLRLHLKVHDVLFYAWNTWNIFSVASKLAAA